MLGPCGVAAAAGGGGRDECGSPLATPPRDAAAAACPARRVVSPCTTQQLRLLCNRITLAAVECARFAGLPRLRAARSCSSLGCPALPTRGGRGSVRELCTAGYALGLGRHDGHMRRRGCEQRPLRRRLVARRRARPELAHCRLPGAL